MNEHCVSLELAKELKVVGWNKETEFWWELNSLTKQFDLQNKDKEDNYGFLNGIKYPAPLATEILEELPQGISIRKGWGFRNDYIIFDNEANEICNDKSLPNALAKYLLYLIKSGK